MGDVMICQVINSVDKKLMIISTKWSDQQMNIIILREGGEPLKADVQLTHLTEPAKHFNKSELQYLQEIKNELSGKTEGIEFSLKKNIFQWKKKAWKRGLIECQSISNILDLSSSIMNILMNYSSIEKMSSDLKIENDDLRIKSENLEKKLNEMINLKNRMEEELYKKFIVLLNSKKKKNQELREKLKNKEIIYDQSTDESDDNDENPKNNFSCDNGKSLEDFNASNNDSDESFVLKFSQSQEKNLNASNDDLFSD